MNWTGLGIKFLRQKPSKKYSDDFQTSKFNYTYETNGKITSLIGTSGSSTETVNYQYQCN